MKTEVYSWRVSAELKTTLEQEAHRRKLPLAAVLDTAARDWLEKSVPDADSDAEQLRLRKAALACIGTISGGDPLRSENVRQEVRERLRRRRV